MASFIAACDEVGRGPLAGPVVAACSFVTYGYTPPPGPPPLFKAWRLLGVTDSKKLTSGKRQNILRHLGLPPEKLAPRKIFEFYREKKITASLAIAEIFPTQIDEINIHHASLLAMKQAFILLYEWASISRGCWLVDGPHLPRGIPPGVEAQALVKGDQKSTPIALASLAAKEYRDHLMKKWDSVYPGYGFARHMGYPTIEHRQAIAELGVTPLHRKTFKGVREFVSPSPNR